MLDPLQNILDCANVIVQCQSKRPMSWLQLIGEVDHACEIKRQLEEIKLHKRVSGQINNEEDEQKVEVHI